MLQLKDIVKQYKTGDTNVEALKGVSIKFRPNEFVSILGPSGCGKTTLLNVIGGLDKYNSGDLKIDGKSTKEYKDNDWDTYRNHFIGFIFQSYNLIMHLTVLENVELALSIAGYSKQEKRQKAINALESVGLKDQIHKKPNQLSGGQMQRVAIARAIVNNPKIILADEPTGALDTETSVQIMQILKDLSKDKLIIMVTHNQELAHEYSSRIINILDGNITGDSNPIMQEENVTLVEENIDNNNEQQNNVESKTKKRKLKKHTSMSFWTAFKLSLRNLGTKKTRTILTSFAGSIGIIGIALILALSSGFQAYVTKTEQDTMSTYPIEIKQSTVSLDSTLENLMKNDDKDAYPEEEKVLVNNMLESFLASYGKSSHKNDLKAFKTHLEQNLDKKYVNAVQYSYDITFNVYSTEYNETLNQKVNPYEIPANLLAVMPSLSMLSNQLEVWSEMIDNQDILNGQYELLGENSKWPQNYNEVVIVVDEYNQINDFVLYALGMRDENEITAIIQSIVTNTPLPESNAPTSYTFDELLNKDFKVVLEGDYYKQNGDIWENMSEDTAYMKQVLDNSITLDVVGIVRPKEGSSVQSINSTIAYSKALTNYMIEKNNQTPVVVAQTNNPETNIFTNASFEGTDQSYLTNIKKLSVADLDNPSSIYIYPAEFDAKEYISEFIAEYNNQQTDPSKKIEYSDFIGLMLSSVTVIINAITYVLIAFVSISLVVSSIMIGIITYISVLERTNEIGILRSVGARKKDVKRVFNAETLIVGFISGFMGIALTYLLTIPINLILKKVINISNIAQLNILHALILVAISMTLTLISGLIPASLAAKKDPVTALRAE